MDPQAGSSFIPKKPLSGEQSSPAFGGLLFSLALLAFLASVAAAGAVFGYQQYLTAAIASKDDSLKKTEDAFDADVIENLVRTDRRIKEMQGLLGRHTAPSAVFALLSELTLGSVQYTGFTYLVEDDKRATIELTGIADSFSSVALQSDQFGSSKHLSGVVFSGITINATGRVDFSVAATVEPAAISYAKQVLEPGAAPQVAPEPASAATTTPAAESTPAAPAPLPAPNL